ncbi:uncharacterized protein LOC106774358 [Vigna radiata var. radiata]|uniref:Uncharacterized protein LOC106774358 n=1 Tax=Vigna radiata var. radiata TaxID=3916 RepID=A0A1S3VEW1_VIGRR|nr:uncharacterized protein LOC106774358 [Vigna radiata var. radiata]
MKALTSSCSKAVVDTLGSLPPRVAIHVSDRPEFFLSTRPRKEKKGCNLWLLKVVPIKGVFPVHAVPSKDQVDLETAEPEAQNNEQTNESKFVRVAFELQKDCDFGEQFLIVGDDPTLGSWDPLEALPMTWSEGHVWTAEQDMPVGKSIQFKFILKGKEGDIIWQPGPDRVINTWETVNTITVCEDWENAELQKITEEDQLAEPDKEPQIDSEVSASAEILDLDSNASEITAVEIPLTAPVTDNGIVAENIISHEDLIKNTSSKWNEKIEPSEESADIAGNDDIVLDLGNNGSAASLENEEETIVESSLLFDFESVPVLVPGLTIPSIEPTNEASQGEKVQEKTTKDISIEASETDQDQNPPKLSKEQDGTPQEIKATINNLSPDTEDNSNYEPEDGTLLQNQIKRGHESVMKFLSLLGLRGGSNFMEPLE